MPAPLPWSPKDSSVLLALQSDLVTPNTTDSDFVALACIALVPKFETESVEFELLTGRAGAEPEVVPGRRKGSVTVSMPVEGLRDDYNGATESPGGVPAGAAEIVPPWFCWYGNVLGSHIDGISTSDPLATQNTAFWRGTHLSCNEYTAAGVTAAGTDATHVTLDNATASDKIKAGETVLIAVDGTSEPQWGWVKTKAGQLLTLFEASQTVVANNAANVYGTCTAWVSDEKQRPLTMRWTGEQTNHCYELTGIMVEKVKLTLNAGEISNVEFSCTFEDFQVFKGEGGLVVADAYERMASIIGAHLGAVMIDTADKAGLEDVSVEYSCELRKFTSHSGQQGVSAVVPIKPRVRMQMSVLHDNADGVYDAAGAAATKGSHEWQARFEQKTSVSVGVYVGPRVGRCMAIRLPASKLKAAPDPSDRGDLLAYAVVLGAEAYSGDTSDTAETSADSPIDSLFSVSLG